MGDRAIDWFSQLDPHKRRRFTFGLLFWSLALGHVNTGLFLGGIVSHELMDLITNYLSWMAISVGAAEALITSDVRVQQEEENKD